MQALIHARRLFPMLVILMIWLASCSNAGNVGNSSTVITDRFNSMTVQPGQIATVTASCNGGEQMVSGGWGLDPPNYNDTIAINYPLDQYFVAASYPSNPFSWTVVFINRGLPQHGVLLVVHVECLSRGSAPTILSATDIISTVVVAHCPSQTTLTGGGYQLTNIIHANQVVALLQSRPILQSSVNPTGWLVETRQVNNSTVTRLNLVKSYAVCSSQGVSTVLGPSATISAPSGPRDQTTSATGEASCDRGQVPFAGGFQKQDHDGSLPLSIFFPSYGTTSEWDVTLYSLPSVGIDDVANYGGSAMIIPICASIG